MAPISRLSRRGHDRQRRCCGRPQRLLGVGGHAVYAAEVVDDLNPRDTVEIRRRVVMPVANSLLRANELEDVLVEVRQEHFPAVGRSEALRVAVKACGEWIEAPRRWLVTDESWNARWLADELYDLLRDELAESRFAWGELREGTFKVPPAQWP